MASNRETRKPKKAKTSVKVELPLGAQVTLIDRYFR